MNTLIIELFYIIEVFIFMGKKGFVYIWKNLTNGKKYIGYHVGNLNDGYISSSRSELFWNDFNNPKMEWIREIVYTGDSNSCLAEEQNLLKNIDLGDEMYYNNARGATIIFNEEVRKKISNATKKRWLGLCEGEKIKFCEKISNSKKGIPRKLETIQKLKDYYDNNDNFIGIISKDDFLNVKEIIRKKKYRKEKNRKI